MSLFGMMRTGVSGMNAQANRLGTVADNIANSGTTGYKKASTEFSSLILPSSGGNYNSGGVTTTVRYAISSQGMLNYTTSATDLAITGSGFFVVQNSSGAPYLTRAGSFVPDQNGNLVNAAGYQLLGYPYSSGAPAAVANGLGGLVPITLKSSSLVATPSTQGTLNVNLPSSAATVGTAIILLPPSQNPWWPTYSSSTPIESTSPSGTSVYSDVYYTKIADNTWEVTVFDSYGARATGLPYDLTSGSVTMATTTLVFDPETGALLSGNPILVTNPADPVSFDFSGLLQEATWDSSATSIKIKQNLPSDDPVIGSGDLLPSSNDPSSTYQKKIEIWSGNLLNIYFTHTGVDTWEVTAYDGNAGLPVLRSDFPYAAPPGTSTLTFDMTTGNLVSGGTLAVPLFGGGSVDLDLSGLVSVPTGAPGSSAGFALSLNLPAATQVYEPRIYGTTPAVNEPDSTYTQKTSLVAHDNLGGEVLLDIYYTKGPDNKWEVTVFNKADASANGFPYSSPPLATELMEFDPSNGKLLGGGSISLTVPGGSKLTIDLSKTTQLAAGFTVQDAKLNGNAPGMAVGFQISDDGIVYAQYENGDLEPIYRLAMADVPSPDQLRPLAGNVFEQTGDSGAVRVGFAGSGGFGKISSGALENSNVDIAEELTTMIEAQRSYTANSKVFQTGADLMDILVNLKR